GGRRTQSACTDDQRTSRQQPFLPLDTQLVEQQVPRVAQQLLIIHRGAPGAGIRAGGTFSGGASCVGVCGRTFSRMPDALVSEAGFLLRSASVLGVALAAIEDCCTGLPCSRLTACCS